MSNKTYYFTVKVTAKAPQGFKPRTMSITGLAVSDKPNAAATVQAKAIEVYKEALTAANPGIEFRYTATATNLNPQFVVVDTKAQRKGKAAAADEEKTVNEPELPDETVNE